MPAEAYRCLQLRKTPHCRCLQVPKDACGSRNHHTADACKSNRFLQLKKHNTVDACRGLQMPAAPTSTTLSMPAGAYRYLQLQKTQQCWCLQMQTCACNSKEHTTLLMPAHDCICLQLQQAPHCRCLQVPTDACSSKNHHNVGACRCRQVPATRALLSDLPCYKTDWPTHVFFVTFVFYVQFSNAVSRSGWLALA